MRVRKYLLLASGVVVCLVVLTAQTRGAAVGKAAVELALEGENAVMPTIVRKSSKPYRWTVGKVGLAEVANKEKMMPRSFISKDGFGITAPCRDYLAPLIRGEDYPPYKDGLPTYVSLKNQRVRKKLKTEFVLK